MTHAIPVFAAIILCLALAGVVSWDLAPLIAKPRARGTAAAVRPALEHRRGEVPIADPAAVRAKVAALSGAQHTGACPYPAPTREQPACREQFRVPPYMQQVDRWLP